MTPEEFEKYLDAERMKYGSLSLLLVAEEKTRAAAINIILTDVLLRYQTILPPPTTLN